MSGEMRDHLAKRLANAALAIATPRYRVWIRNSIEYGLRSAARDVRDGNAPPPDWRGTTTGREPLPRIEFGPTTQPTTQPRTPAGSSEEATS